MRKSKVVEWVDCEEDVELVRAKEGMGPKVRAFLVSHLLRGGFYPVYDGTKKLIFSELYP
jgi:hypothetical protein